MRLKALASGLIAVLCLAILSVDPVAAESEGSASSRVIGRGDIVTSILLRSRSTNRSAGRGPAPECKSHTFTDAEIEFLVALIAHDPTAVDGQLLLSLFRNHLIETPEPDSSDPDSDPGNGSNPDDPTGLTPTSPPDEDLAPEFDVWARICDGFVAEARTVPRASPSSVQAILGRKMVTRLPQPAVVQSPPVGVSVPVNEPVFISIPGKSWQQVDTTLSAGGVIADVRAEPVAVRVFTGETDADFHVCNGPGVPFNRLSAERPSKQATRPGACVVRYRQANHHDGTTLDKWLGTVTVLWSAEWRTNGGPWRSLGLIPRTRLFERHAGEVTTVIGAAPGSTRRR